MWDRHLVKLKRRNSAILVALVAAMLALGCRVTPRWSPTPILTEPATVPETVPPASPTAIGALPTTGPTAVSTVVATGAPTEDTPPPVEQTAVPIIPTGEAPIVDQGRYSENYFSPIDLPVLTGEERLQLALQARRNPQAFAADAHAQATELSDKLEAYVREWLGGRAAAKLPDGLLPPYMDSDKTHDWTLMKPEQASPEEQWFIQAPVHEIDPEYKQLYMFGVDSHVTYLKLLYVAPLGSKLLVEGDFPHARFMDYEIQTTFDPEHPAAGRNGETPEVVIVDADIEPDPGHVNPFRVGADRNAPNRHYHLTFELAAGNSVELNPQAMVAPEYRGPGNTRVAGPFGYAGVWGDGALVPATLFLRIYAPDKGTGPLGGVSIPKAILELPSGEQYWLQPDATLAIERQTTRVAAGSNPPIDPIPAVGPTVGWQKIFGLVLVRAETQGRLQSQPWGLQPAEPRKERIRTTFELFFNRGADADPPGNHESGLTMCHYSSYLTRMFLFGQGMTYAITGRLPTTPKTRDGESVMTAAEARYWSISQYGHGEGEKYESAVHYGSAMDDEIVVDENDDYIILYSTQDDRPANARPECGVTWMDRGPRSNQTITIRWLSVMPEWHLPRYAPDTYNVPWRTGAWSGEDYDESLIGRNAPGVMGPYHPVIHYLSTAEFEALGCPIDPGSIPEWTQ